MVTDQKYNTAYRERIEYFPFPYIINTASSEPEDKTGEQMKTLRTNLEKPTEAVTFLSIQAEAGEQRTELFNGEEYTVIPIIGLVEGVIQAANSPQAELALAEEFGKHVEGWNGRPVVVDHPQKNGQYVSANSPEMLESEQIGLIFNARVANKKLHLEAWVNNSAGDDAEDRISDTVKLLANQEVVEVSTGIFVDIRPQSGRFNGEDYSGVWTDTTPDHLAILSGGKLGACSIEDGCGANRVNHATNTDSGGTCTCQEKPMPNANEGGLLESGPAGDDGHTHMYNSFGSDGETEPGGADGHTHHYVMIEDETQGGGEDAHTHGISNLRKNEGRQNVIARWLSKLFKTAELSDTDRRAAIQSSLEGLESDSFGWVVAVFDDSFVYETWDGLFRRAYEFSEDGTVTISEESEKVRPETDFVTVKTNEENPDMDIKAKVDALIANESTKFTEDSRSFLEGLDEAQIDLMEPVEVVASPAVTEPEGDPGSAGGSPEDDDAAAEPMSAEAYIAQAPEEIRDVLKSSMGLRAEKRKNIISQIVANERNAFSEAELNEMDMGTLEKLAPLAKVDDFSGRGVPSVNAEDPNAVPAPPSIFQDKETA